MNFVTDAPENICDDFWARPSINPIKFAKQSRGYLKLEAISFHKMPTISIHIKYSVTYTHFFFLLEFLTFQRINRDMMICIFYFFLSRKGLEFGMLLRCE